MILAFGDSLTNGYGIGSDYSYPAQIKKKTDLNVINAGMDGEFSIQGLSRLPIYLERKPKKVILCHGANDILCNYSSKNLKNNLLSMIKLIKENDIDILLVGVPNYHSDGFEVHPLYREVAQETGVFLEDSILSKIQKNSSLRNDEVHPNEEGYELMADAFIKILKSLGEA